MQPFIIVTIDVHGVFVLITKKDLIPSLHKPILIIIITRINYKYFPTLFLIKKYLRFIYLNKLL
jgi:hypothetical protein